MVTRLTVTQRGLDETAVPQVVVAQTLTLNAPIATKVICFSRLLKCLRSLYGKGVDPDQTAPIGAVCSGSTLFASILNLQ